MTEAPARQRINSVARAVNILLAVARSPQGLSVKEISEALAIERQTTYHLLHTLSAMNMLFRDERRRYLLGLKAGLLAEAFQRQFSAPDFMRPLVRELSLATEETCYAVGWSQGEIVTLAVMRGSSMVHTAEVPFGSYGDAHARAAGKLLLALAPASQRNEYLKAHPRVRRTQRTITRLKDWEAEVEKVQRQRYAVDNEEFAEGMCCLAIPVETGATPYALALSAPAERYREHFKQYLKKAHSIMGSLLGKRLDRPDMARDRIEV
jgi:DNA-binding IclR family transcriptional regulator